MKQSWLWWIAGVLTLGAVGAAIGSRPQVPESTAKIAWVDQDAPRRIRAHASKIEDLANWPGLGNFLVAVAYIESRGNSRAGSSNPTSNAARGWYGIRPSSSRASDVGLNPQSSLKNEVLATALAAWYAHRLRAYAAPGQRIDWLALRRGWGIPGHVDEIDHPGYWQQFATGLKAAGVPASFMLEPAFSRGYSWPGIAAVIDALNQ